MASVQAPLSIIQLVGDELENIYQLGLRDRERHEPLFHQIQHFLSTPYPLFDRMGKKMASYLVNYNLEHNSSFEKKIQAYAEGLAQDPKEVAYAMLIPELVSSMSKWIPGLPSGLLGCSSFFLLDEKSGKPVHGRILDFPLQGSFDTEERILSTHYNGQQKVVSLGSCGFPLASITCMNEAGVTLAMHQKFTTVFHTKGTSIFEIAHQFISTIETKADALKWLKEQQSITTWCFYLSFAKSNEVLAVDLMGEKLVSKTYGLKEKEVLYFNNDLIQKAKFPTIPYGVEEYNQLRTLNAKRKIAKLKRFDEVSLLKLMTTPLDLKFPQAEQIDHYDTLTSSSVSVCTLHPGAQSMAVIEGEAPKFFRGEIAQVTNCFENPKMNKRKEKGKTAHPDYQAGLRFYAKAQIAYDAHEIHKAYHCIQMGMAHFKTGYYFHYGRFFLNVFEFIHETHEKNRQFNLSEFRELKDLMSPYLKDQCQLFIYRLERLLGVPSELQMKEIKHPELKKVFRLEQRIPTSVLHKMTTLFMAPRIDIRDVITVEIKPND